MAFVKVSVIAFMRRCQLRLGRITFNGGREDEFDMQDCSPPAFIR